MNDKQNDGNRNTGIGDVERRPGMCVRNVQIEEEKIDDVPINKAVGKIPQNTGEQKRKRHIAQKIALSPPHEKGHNNEKRDG